MFDCINTVKEKPNKIFKVISEDFNLKQECGKFLNIIKDKITNNLKITKKELLMISLLCFMSTVGDVEHTIHDSAVTISNITGLDKDIAQFAKGVVLMLCDKFVDDAVKYWNYKFSKWKYEKCRGLCTKSGW